MRAELGEGGAGVVYRVWDAALGKEVALKRMRALGPREAQKLKSEFRARSALQHTNLVQLYELVVEGDDCFFTMELVEGSDLASWVRTGNALLPASEPSGSQTRTTADVPGRRPRDVDARVTVKRPSEVKEPLTAAGIGRLREAVTQLVLGLGVLHQAGIVHRDVKPSNVRVTPEGRVVLLDFGLAASPADGGAEFVAGTPRYMAPEQVRAEPTGPATDLYAVGVVLYELLAGRSPFGGSVISLQLRKAGGERAAPMLRGSLPSSADAAGTDDKLAELAMALLEPEASARPTARAVLAALAGPGALPSVAPTFGLPGGHLFGRQHERDALEAALARVAVGGAAAGAVLVEGPSGIGKTTLVRSFLAELKARDPSVLVLAARCHPQENIPFKALDAAMDRLADHAATVGDLGSFEPLHAHAAARLFPVLRNVPALAASAAGADAQALPDEGELRAYGIEALRELLHRLRQRGPIVLWIDDVQWDDADSLALLDALFRPHDAPALLLVLAMRWDSRSSAIVKRLADPHGPVPLERIVLGPLADEHVARLATTFLGEDDSRVENVVSQSEGNAFLACELARYLANLPSTRWPEPVSRSGFDVKALVAARLRGLLPAERAILDVASLSVHPIPVTCALDAAHLGTEARTSVLALRDGFLIRHGALDEIATYHDKIAEATQSLLSDEERAAVHRSLAEALGRHTPDDAVALAVHWEGAGDRLRAGQFAFQAAERAETTLAFGRAAELFEKTIALDWRGLERSLLLERAARAYANHGAAPEAARRYLDASKLLGDDVAMARVRTLKHLAAEQYVKSGYVKEGWEVMRSVLAAAHVPVPTSPRRATIAALGRRLKFLARRIDIDAIGDRRIPERERARLEILWTASTSMSMVNVSLSDVFRTMHLERIVDVGDRSSVARALAYETALEAHVGGALFDWHATRLIGLARRLVERTADPYDEAWLRLGIANQAFCGGRFREAMLACEASERILRTRCHGVAWEVTTVAAFHLMSVAMLGDLKKLREATERITAEAEAHDDLFGISDGFGGDCIFAWWCSGNADYALARAKAAVARQGGHATTWPEKNYRRGQLTELVATVNLHLLRDEPWLAWERILADWDGLTSAMIPSLQFYRSWIRSVRARAALAAVRQERETGPRNGWTRAKLLADVKRTHAEMAKDKKPFGPPWAALIEGALARAEGDRKAARASLERALAGFDRADMALYREATRYRLAELSDAPSRRAEADAWMREQGVPDPQALVDALVPGY